MGAVTDTKEILEIVNFIKDRMPTKDEGVAEDDLQKFQEELKADIQEIRDELADIKIIHQPNNV